MKTAPINEWNRVCGDGVVIGGGRPQRTKPHTFKTMTDFNLSTRDQNTVHDIETDAEISLDQLAEINGSGFLTS